MCGCPSRPRFPRRQQLQRGIRQRDGPQTGQRFRIVEHSFVDGGAHVQAAIRLIDVPPPQREQLATPKPREQREPHQRPREQPRQLSGQRRGLINRECPFGPDRLQARHLDPTRRIRVEMPPFHRRPEDGAQHVMDVIDRFRRVPRLDQMRHVRLDRLGRDIREG